MLKLLLILVALLAGCGLPETMPSSVTPLPVTPAFRALPEAPDFTCPYPDGACWVPYTGPIRSIRGHL